MVPFFRPSLRRVCARLAWRYGAPYRRPKVVMRAGDTCEVCGPVVLSRGGGVACSKVRETLRDPIWVSTLGLPLVPFDPMIEKSWV